MIRARVPCLLAVLYLLALAAGCDRERCPAGPMMPGANCARRGSTACFGTSVLTCAPPPEGSRCAKWAPAADCALDPLGPLTCGTKGGAAACQCPSPSGTDAVVDPANGSDAKAAPFASGAVTPAVCRFKSVGQALAATTAAGSRVVIGADPASLPVTLTGESFPMTVAPGVTLTSADPANPERATVTFDAADARGALVLGDDASVEGISLVAGSGANARASAVSCSKGEVTLRRLRLKGAAGGSRLATGIAVGGSAGDTCTATLADLSLEGFTNGILVESTTPAPVQIANVTASDTGGAEGGAALVVRGGGVNATALRVLRTAGGTAGGGVLVDALAGRAPAAVSLTDVEVTDGTLPGLEVRAMSTASPPEVRAVGGALRRTGLRGLPGLRVAAGRLEAERLVVGESGGDGIFVENATFLGVGVTSEKNAGDGLESFGGTVTARRAIFADNVGRGVYIQGGTATVDDGTAVRRNGVASRAAGVRFLAGQLILGGATGEVVEISDSGLNGLNIEGPGATGSVTVTRVRILRSAEFGVHVDLNAPGGAVRLREMEIAGNTYGGVVVRRAPAVGDLGLAFENLTVRENGTARQPGAGLWLRGDQGAVVASVRNSAFRSNSDVGIRIAQGEAQTTASLEGNAVEGNNTGGRNATGGILFETASTLARFAGNRIAGNVGAQLGFAAAPNGGGRWQLRGMTESCEPPGELNEVACWGEGIGIRVSAATTVDAGYLRFAPGPRDFVGSDGGTLAASMLCPLTMASCAP